MNLVRSPFRTAEAFLIEEIIDPRDTRPLLCEFADLAAPLRAAGPNGRGVRPLTQFAGVAAAHAAADGDHEAHRQGRPPSPSCSPPCDPTRCRSRRGDPLRRRRGRAASASAGGPSPASTCAPADEPTLEVLDVDAALDRLAGDVGQRARSADRQRPARRPLRPGDRAGGRPAAPAARRRAAPGRARGARGRGGGQGVRAARRARAAGGDARRRPARGRRAGLHAAGPRRWRRSASPSGGRCCRCWRRPPPTSPRRCR